MNYVALLCAMVIQINTKEDDERVNAILLLERKTNPKLIKKDVAQMIFELGLKHYPNNKQIDDFLAIKPEIIGDIPLS